jgi:hypothetical protein
MSCRSRATSSPSPRTCMLSSTGKLAMILAIAVGAAGCGPLMVESPLGYPLARRDSAGLASADGDAPELMRLLGTCHAVVTHVSRESLAEIRRSSRWGMSVAVVGAVVASGATVARGMTVNQHGLDRIGRGGLALAAGAWSAMWFDRALSPWRREARSRQAAANLMWNDVRRQLNAREGARRELRRREQEALLTGDQGAMSRVESYRMALDWRTSLLRGRLASCVDLR